MGTPEKAMAAVRGELTQVLSILKAERNPVRLRIETMGKLSQIGSLDEVLSLCREVEGLAPCLDFSHLHAREGRANTYLDFHRILRKVEKRLGKSALRDMHIHISGIEYSAKGEVKHLNLADSDFRYDEWTAALRDMDVAGLVICESPSRETDAIMLKNLYSAFELKR
jgi:deoxyribonuclease-4